GRAAATARPTAGERQRPATAADAPASEQRQLGGAHHGGLDQCRPVRRVGAGVGARAELPAPARPAGTAGGMERVQAAPRQGCETARSPILWPASPKPSRFGIHGLLGTRAPNWSKPPRPAGTLPAARRRGDGERPRCLEVAACLLLGLFWG